MNNILCIDSAIGSCSVALAKNGELIAFEEKKEVNKTAEVINLLIDKILAKFQNVKINAVAVTAGARFIYRIKNCYINC